MKKRMLSILLVACMMVVMIPAAFAVQLTTPTGLEWVTEAGTIEQIGSNGAQYTKSIYPFDIVFNSVPNAANEYRVVLYKDGVEVDGSNWYFAAGNSASQLSIDMFSNEPRESGTYTFTVQARGDGQNYEDSAVATSAPIVYTAPAAQLGQATNLRWEGETACWDTVAQALDYSIYWYYSATADGPFEDAGFTRGMHTTSLPLEDWVVLDHGAGYYKFAIRAMTNDVTQLRPSELSAQSGVYYTGDAADSVGSQLDDILENLGDSSASEDIATAIEAVKKLDSDELRVAMEADTTGNGVTAQIAELESKTQVSLSTSVDESFGINKDDISLTGAALNAGSNQSVTFHIGKPAQDAVVSGVYANAVQFDFELQGAATESNGEFAVPIKIKMPVPENITPQKLRILHYTENGKMEEILLPALSEENGVWYATFVVKHFSVFVFAEGDTAALIGKTPYTSLQEAINFAKSGDTIDLYRNSDDTELRVANKSLTINCNTYKLRSDVDWQLTNCTKSETTDTQGHTVIIITYTGGSSSSGGGGSNSSNKPTASVSGSGGKVTVANDGTVTITPDTGYQIAKITVNGKEVDIPTNGKLTGLTKDDKVVVTFEKVPAEEQPGTSATPFTDVAAGAWYADAVQYVYEKGMMTGTSATSFSPDKTTTRGMIVTMLHRLENEPSATASDFTDVAAGAYYADAVAWAAANGVVNGISKTAFAPETAITREQMAAILYRYAQLKGYDVSVGEDTNILSYTDAGQISEYAIPAMQWACGAGLIQGNTAATLNPKGNATRAEVATILMRFCEDVA